MAYRKKKEPESILPLLLTFLVLVVLAFALIIIFAWPYLVSLVPLNINIYLSNSTGQQNLTPQLSPDAQFYFNLKNLSCGTLSKDFLIETQDTANGTIVGLITKVPQENAIAQSIASSYNFNQTTRTYVNGTDMKKVLLNGPNNLTLIWKDGRFYSCASNCTMNLLSSDGWQAYLNSLIAIRTNCAFFGHTQLPNSINISKLISIQNTGKQEINGFTCQNFEITGNKDYAQSLFSNASLTDDQRAIIWGLANQVGPINECLDDGDGLVIHRSMTFNLTNIYNFNYENGGGMFVSQTTDTTYYSNYVPESFLNLPSAQ